MEIKFLKAGSGDSILIHHKKYNILVDGGNDSQYLLNEINAIYKKNEVIDLLVITHHDDDHIKGIIDLLQLVIKGDYGVPNKFVKKVFFNSPRIVLKKIPPEQNRLLSYRQAHQVEELLLKTNINWEKCTERTSLIQFDDLKLDFLSPSEDTIEKYSNNKGAYLTNDFRCDWNTSMYRLDKILTDKAQDRSLPNASSIVINLECDHKKILLTGDITPKRFETIIDKLVKENKDKPVYFDYIKLPHHGSYQSLNEKILRNINCSNYVISTDSKKNYHPNKRAILKVLKHKEKGYFNFYFNYEEAMNSLNISLKEMKDYGFNLIANNEDYGISI